MTVASPPTHNPCPNGYCNGYKCNMTDEIQRAWIAGSNIIFLVPVIYTIHLTKKYNLPWYDLLPEMVIFCFTGIFSCLYHMCSNGPFCTKWCLGQTVPNGVYQSPYFSQLQHWDFVFSYMCILVAFSYSTDHFLSVTKVVFLSFGFLFCNLFCNSSYFGTYDIQFYYFLVGYGFLFTIIRFAHYCATNTFTHEMTQHFDKTMGCLALLFLVLGIIFYLAFNPLPFPEYGWGHPAWHITICLALFFEFCMYDPTVAFPCCHVRLRCALCAEIGGLNYARNREAIHTTDFFGIPLVPRRMFLFGQDVEAPSIADSDPESDHLLSLDLENLSTIDVDRNIDNLLSRNSMNNHFAEPDIDQHLRLENQSIGDPDLGNDHHSPYSVSDHFRNRDRECYFMTDLDVENDNLSIRSRRRDSSDVGYLYPDGFSSPGGSICG